MEAKEEEGKTRIYVGGLGEKVTSDDLIKIFSSLGKVKAVDIVRTKGRSFGYVDFYPSSDKSMPKLFSTYNGCVWKGGRLRLEKAKEHYLARLKREWQEEAQRVCSPPSETVDADKDMASLEKPKEVPNSENNLNIFFPRLRKFKSLPFRGSGKHKYSFQRVEVPPVPTYFCDCEEHFVPSLTAEGKQIHDLEAQNGAMNEEELNIMHSVMNKLFERENVSSAARHGTGPANDGNNSSKLVNDPQFGENQADTGDEDNLIINVVSRGNKRMTLTGCQETTTISPVNQKSISSGIHDLKDRPAQTVPKVRKNNNIPHNKRKSLLHEESMENESVTNTGSNVNMRKRKSELMTHLGSQPAATESGVKQSTASYSWSQKMSWRALVGDKDSSVFNVSKVLPVVASAKEAENAVETFQDLQFDENETDEDNLIINVVSKKKNKMAVSGKQEQESNSTMIQKSTFNETQTSEDRPNQSLLNARKNSTRSLKKKRKSLLNEESDRSELVFTTPEDDGCLQTHTIELRNALEAQSTEPDSGGKQSITNHSESQKSSWRALVGDKDKNSNVSNILPDISAEEEEPVSDSQNVMDPTDGSNLSLAKYENLKAKSDETEIVAVLEAQRTKPNEASNKSGRGSSWFQKSPWTQLVTENNNSFSITEISPGITFKKHEVTKPQGAVNILNPTDSKCSNLVKQDKSEATGTGYTAKGREGDVAPNFPEKKQPAVVGNNEAVVENKYDYLQRQMTTEDVSIGSIGETCTFMRSSASLKEWANTKAALNGSHKRKSNER